MDERQKALRWLTSYKKVSRRFAQLDLERSLEEHGGIVCIQDLFPGFVAEAVLDLVKEIPGGNWNCTDADEDYTHNNIAHMFWSTKAGTGLDIVMRALTALLPGRLSSFSAARYDRSHHIAPHDDRAYTQVRMDDGSMVMCSRDIAVIYYLTKDWQPEWGGVLLDLEGSATFVPRFNCAVCFRIPRYHQVTPLLTDQPRYSIFGWFLQEGIHYDLYNGEGDAKGDPNQQLHESAADGVQAAQGTSGRLNMRVGRGGGDHSHRNKKRLSTVAPASVAVPLGPGRKQRPTRGNFV